MAWAAVLVLVAGAAVRLAAAAGGFADDFGVADVFLAAACDFGAAAPPGFFAVVAGFLGEVAEEEADFFVF